MGKSECRLKGRRAIKRPQEGALTQGQEVLGLVGLAAQRAQRTQWTQRTQRTQRAVVQQQAVSGVGQELQGQVGVEAGPEGREPGIAPPTEAAPGLLALRAVQLRRAAAPEGIDQSDGRVQAMFP